MCLGVSLGQRCGGVTITYTFLLIVGRSPGTLEQWIYIIYQAHTANIKSYASFPQAGWHRKDMVCKNESTFSSRVWWTRSSSFWIWVMVDCSIFGSGVYGSDVEEVGCDRPYQWRWQWNRVWSGILIPCMSFTQSHERQYRWLYTSYEIYTLLSIHD